MITVFKNVFNRAESIDIDFLDFINNPQSVFEKFQISDFKDKMESIKNTKNKPERNEAKRNFIPAANFNGSGIFCIDIDDLENNPKKKSSLISSLKNLDYVHCIKESPSGNICVFIKHKYDKNNFKFGYYKYYLKLTLFLEVNIDFLPDLDRLRYVSFGDVYYFNKDSKIVEDIIVVDNLPNITKAYTKSGKSIKYGSR